VLISVCLSYTLLLLYCERVHIRCFTYLLAYLARPVRRRHDVVRRRRDDVVRRRNDVVTTTYDVAVTSYDDVVTTSWGRTYITGFSVTFLCKYLSVFLTRCCYTVNEFIYDTSRIAYLARPVRRRHVVVVRRRDDDVRRRREDDVRRRI